MLEEEEEAKRNPTILYIKRFSTKEKYHNYVLNSAPQQRVYRARTDAARWYERNEFSLNAHAVMHSDDFSRSFASCSLFSFILSGAFDSYFIYYVMCPSVSQAIER